MLSLVLVTILALVSHPTPSASQEDNTLTLPARVINTNEQAVCPSDEVREMVRDEIVQDIRNMIRNTTLPTRCLLGQTQASPVTSCSALPANCPSDYYWVASSSGTAVQVYCDMDRVCGCNSTGGFTRVANLNMSNSSEQCPGELVLQTYSSEPRRLCGRGSSGAGCLSAVYNTYGISYSHVCGRVIGYQYASTDGFGYMQNIEGPYVDGVSLTHGEPGTRVHIWTFAASHRSEGCGTAPSFVGNDYFCDRGSQTDWNYILYTSDPLWDGQGGELNSPPGVMAPWFCKQLPQTTTDDIEIRICGDQATTDEDTPVEIIELYIR